MLFLCYGITANANASHVAFAIICGNKNTSFLRQFWTWIASILGFGWHNSRTRAKNRLPSMYNRLVTYCSFHRRQNIIKMCGGGSGKTANSALWMYKNKLMHCWLWHTKEIQYLNSLSANLSIWQLDAPWLMKSTCTIVHLRVQWSQWTRWTRRWEQEEMWNPSLLHRY